MAGDGTLFQRKSNSKWYWIYNTGDKNPQGKYIQKWYDLETTNKNVAIEKRKQIMADIVKNGQYIPPSNQTYGEWLDFWLNEIIKPKIIAENGSLSTYDYYESLIRVHIKPKLGSIPLKKIEPETLQSFFNQKRVDKKLSGKKDGNGNLIPSDKPLSTRTLRGIEDIITMSIDKAIGMRKITLNPMAGIDKIKHRKKEVPFMTMDQVADFLDKVKYDPWYPVFVMDFGTGLRRSEIVALKWENIDLDKKFVKVDKARVQVNTYAKEGPKTQIITKGPKSKKGERIVPLPDDVVVALKKWKETQIQEMWAWENKRLKEDQEQKEKPWKKPKRKHPRPEYLKSGYVFTFEDGRPVSPDHLTKHFQELMQKHGYEGFTFHKQRHSYATMLLENGVDMKTIQENLGDATLKIVSDTYTHVAEKLKRQAVDRLSGFTQKRIN